MQTLLQQVAQQSTSDGYTFDTYLNNKLKYGAAQLKLSRPLFLMLFSQGSQSVVLGLIIPTLIVQWQINTFQKSLLITFVYIGVIIGSILQSVADNYGRYPVITAAGIFQAIAGLLTVISPNYAFFLFIRFLYGIGIGIVLPLSGTYLSEITPNDKRATLLSNSRVFWSVGSISTSILAYFFLQNNHWRILLLLICLPGIYALYLHKKEGQQSPRFLFLKGQYQQARLITEYMQQLNQSNKMTQSQFYQLTQWSKRTQIHMKQNISYKRLFQQKYKLQTIKVIIAWFTVCFVYYGIMLLLPLILMSHSKSRNTSYLVIIIVSTFEVVSFYTTNTIIDYPLFGRKNTLIISFLICSFCSLILMFDLGNFLFACMFIFIKFFVTLAFMTLYSYTAELYHTLVRSKAMGITSFIGRISTVLLGLIGVYALQSFGGKGLYLIFLLLSLSSMISIYTMEYDTLGRDLDKR